MSEEPKPGPTGEFPAGKMTAEDEGAIGIKIASHATGNVVIEFGKPTAWFAMPPAMARQLAASLMAQARISEAAALTGEDPEKARH